nr:MAG TPA: hypothetical protein [Caudoviricetes sp.]
MKLIPNVNLASFRQSPTKIAKENPITRILSNSSTAFYTVTEEKMNELIKKEEELKEMDLFMWSIQDAIVEIMFAIEKSGTKNEWLSSQLEYMHKLTKLECE